MRMKVTSIDDYRQRREATRTINIRIEGDFHVAWRADAERLSAALDLPATETPRGLQSGFPSYRAVEYLAALKNAGFRVVAN